MSFKMVQHFPCKAFQTRWRSKSSGSWNPLRDFALTGNQSTIPDKRVGTRTKFSLPPTFNVDNQVIFPFFVVPTLIRGEGGYVIQLKCPNYFWPGLSERDMRGIFQ